MKVINTLSVICFQITFHLQMATSQNDPQQQWMQQQQQQVQAGPSKLSDEEQRVMVACQSESFWYRSIPASGFLAFLAHMGVSNGALKPHSKWGSRPKILYRNRLEDRLKRPIFNSGFRFHGKGCKKRKISSLVPLGEHSVFPL